MSNNPLPTTAQIEQFITLCKKSGVTRGRLGDLEIEFAPTIAAGPDVKKMKALADALAGDMLSNEQALFGSAPQPVSYEQIQEMLKQVQGG